MTRTVSSPAFTTLPLSPAQLANLTQMGYEAMTPIQAESLPAILDGRDLIAQAKTGSGKTAAFGLGVLHRLNPARFSIQALVICPTRELAEQVAIELRRLARAHGNVKVLTLTGGASARPQIESLAHGAHIIVGTPGRILDLLDRQILDLSGVHTLVLDEADRMVDMGFFPDVVDIVNACPVKRQTLLFSATYPATIRDDADRFLNDPVRVTVDTQHTEVQIEQHFFEVDDEYRYQATAQLLGHYRPESALAFCNTKAQCAQLTDYLRAQGFSALALHGDKDQRDRDDVLMQFANQSCNVLVATDVAARGLDIPLLGAVINVELARDPQVHVHRIGRTGRVNENGLALSLCAPQEKHVAEKIEAYQGMPLRWSKLSALKRTSDHAVQAPMATLLVLGGKKAKLRPGDLLGALTGEGGVDPSKIGKINVTEQVSYVALDRKIAHATVRRLGMLTVKGKKQRIKLL